MSRAHLPLLAAVLCSISACETPPEDGTQTGGACEFAQCPADSTCVVIDDDAFCDCNDGFVGSGDRSASRCYPATTEGGTCRDTADGIACDCIEGYVHERYATQCTPGVITCDDLTCGDNATCHVTANAAECRCNTGYAGDGQTCTPSGPPCPNGCPDGAVCIGLGVESRCECDADHYPLGPILCEPKVTASGTCDIGSSNAIVCSCNPGYEQLANAARCSDIDECTIPEDAPGGCKAWCTNLEGSATCASTVADPSSPFWDYSCDANDPRFQPPTQLEVDCRCGGNMTPDNDSPLGMCWRPIGAATEMARPYRYGSGPAIVDVIFQTPEVLTMVMHQASRKIYLGVGYTEAAFGIGAGYTGAIIEVDADTGDRRVVAGFWPDEFGGTHHPEGMDMLAMTGLTHLPEVQNLVLGPDGETLFAWVQDHYSNAQILKVDRITGAMELMWAEHLVLPMEPRHNLPEHAQCWNGERVAGRKFVQINNRGFAMDTEGNYLLNVVATSAANWLSPVGIVRISADGTSCEWVRRTGAGPYNAYFDGAPSGGTLGVGSDPIDVDCDGTIDTADGFVPLDAKFYAPVAPCGSGYFAGGNPGTGAAPAAGSPFRALHWVGDKLWAFDANTYGLWEIDTEHASGWRVRNIGDNLAEDWIVEDPAREVVWLAGTGSQNNMGAFHFDEDPAQRWWHRVSPVCGAIPGPFPCLRGPMSTYATVHQPIVLDRATGYIIAQHGPGTVRIEPETGNTVTFSL